MTTLDEDLGKYGAKRQSWKPSARELLLRLHEENPEADEGELRRIFELECAPYFPEIVGYWFTNNYRALIKGSNGTSGKRGTGGSDRDAPEPYAAKADAARSEEAAEAAAAFVKARAVKMLLDEIILPSGKTLRNSTCGECTEAGGWYTRLGRLGQPRDIVGDIATEKEVRAALEG